MYQDSSANVSRYKKDSLKLIWRKREGCPLSIFAIEINYGYRYQNRKPELNNRI
jgi:hypothetical protein